PARATDAFGDVLARELDVHAAQARAEPGVQLERLLELADDLVEAARLDALRRGFGVAVHRVADPEHGAAGLAHRVDERGQLVLHLVGTHAMDERDAARL